MENVRHERALRGNAIILHRNYRPTFFPRDEAGPAALIDRTAHDWYSVARLANRLETGSVYPWEMSLPARWTWLGLHAGRPQSVQVASPWMPPLHLHETELDWRTWSEFTVSCETDAVILWQPRALFPRMTLREVAEHLLTRWVCAGGVYEADDLTKLASAQSVGL